MEAKNLGEIFGDAVKGIGTGVIKKLEKRIERRIKRLGTKSAGMCIVYDRLGNKEDELPCRERIRCRKSNRCFATYDWSTGSRTVVEYRNDKPVLLNGKKLRSIVREGHDCFENQQTENSFCFVKDAPSRLPDNEDEFEPEDALIAPGIGTAQGFTQTHVATGLPPSGIYHYWGEQNCGKFRKRVYATIIVSGQDSIRANFGSRNLHPNGNLIDGRRGQYGFDIALAANPASDLVFHTVEQHSKSLVRGYFAGNEHTFVGEWLPQRGGDYQKCGRFELALSDEPSAIYADLYALLQTPSPDSAIAHAVGELEKTRPPLQFTVPFSQARNVMQTSLYRDYANRYAKFWKHFMLAEAARIAALPVDEQRERDAVKRRIREAAQLSHQWSANSKRSVAFEDELYTVFADAQHVAGLRPETRSFDTIERACRRLLGIDNRSRENEISYLFGFPLEHWDAQRITEFSDRATTCARRYPRYRTRFGKIARHIGSNPSEVRHAVEVRDWLTDRAYAMLEMPADLQTLMKTNDFTIGRAVLRQRKISERTYQRLFLRAVTGARVKALEGARGEITRFFEARNFGSYAPDMAVTVCQKVILLRFDRGIVPTNKGSSFANLSDHCQQSANAYIVRVVTAEIDRLVERALAQPANLGGLRAANWFLLPQDTLQKIPYQRRNEARQRFEANVEAHRNRALNIAAEHVTRSFSVAQPFQASEKAALRLCANLNGAPNVIRNTCRQASDALSERRETARCEHARVRFGASESVLNSRIIVSARSNLIMRMDNFVCEAARNRNDLSLTIGGGGLAFWSSPYLLIHSDDGEPIAELELTNDDIPDNRSFTKYLVDIATGVNEELDFTRYRVSKIVSDKANISNGSRPDSVLGCIFRFSNCN